MKIAKHSPNGHVDGDAAVKEALKLVSRRVEQPSRRAFLERSLTLGGLAMLGGCSITNDAGVEAALMKSRGSMTAFRGGYSIRLAWPRPTRSR